MAAKLKPKDRPHAGFKEEDRTARQLKRKGCTVTQPNRNEQNTDMRVNGRKVEVKAAVETSYKGSDGYPITGFVFSNMKKNPSAEKYILKCMSPDRKRVLKEYHIPSSQVKQRTLTLTRNSKYERFKKASHPQPFVRGFEERPTFVQEDSLNMRIAGLTGALIGGVAGFGANNTLDALRGKRVENAPFVKTLIGASMGRAIARGVVRHEQNKDSKRRIQQRRLRGR